MKEDHCFLNLPLQNQIMMMFKFTMGRNIEEIYIYIYMPVLKAVICKLLTLLTANEMIGVKSSQWKLQRYIYPVF